MAARWTGESAALTFGTRQWPWAHYAFGLLPAFFVAVLLVIRPQFTYEPPVTPLIVAPVGFAIALLVYGLLIIHLTRGAVGLAIGALFSWLAVAVLVLGPAVILMVLNALS